MVMDSMLSRGYGTDGILIPVCFFTGLDRGLMLNPSSKTTTKRQTCEKNFLLLYGRNLN